ncbi:hypothetical protein [Mariniblastus fucicola]|uniref:hypothetical protein n=1 Tax=Mariniblastus fucicola TaxID=980251 RepID=UPI0012FA9DAA|nr:hypothetical protein [Mariniblastus fucicola]
MQPLRRVIRQLGDAGVKAARIGKANPIDGVTHPQDRSEVQLAYSNHADDVLDFAGAGR